MSRDVSLLLASGQQDARNYPIGRLTYEASLVNERLNNHFVTEAVLTQSAIGSCLSNEGSKLFQKTIKSLSDVH